MNRFTLEFVASMAALSTLPVLALEPGHDFTAKAMKEKAAKKQAKAREAVKKSEAALATIEPQTPPKETAKH